MALIRLSVVELKAGPMFALFVLKTGPFFYGKSLRNPNQNPWKRKENVQKKENWKNKARKKKKPRIGGSEKFFPCFLLLGPLRLRIKSLSRMRLRIAASIALLFRTYF